jgi:putative FmdB family regulatory protein
MPIYEYVCPNCGHIFEKLMRGSSRARQAAVECPSCGEQSHRKEVTLVASVGSDGPSLGASGASCAPSG